MVLAHFVPKSPATGTEFPFTAKLQFIWIKIANNPLNTLHYLQKAHLSSDTKLIDLADINIYDASVQTDECD